ncbi:hypothetical protein BVRB_009100 [Beta vulgaris subsp. vulgaris]|uniref:Uncharacterized protein n=1 Tax=Beta vulgaris subsp. vulgaris TaxID=3555 RepID=A0A0J8B6C1_BETVV|nr:hypothetical protein BVRB_009100 [Beta vulgaris subsp. vulgaris]
MENRAFLLLLVVCLTFALGSKTAVSLSPGRTLSEYEDLTVNNNHDKESYVVDLTLVEDMESEDQIEGTIPRRMMIITTSDYQTGPNNDHNPGRGGR